MAALAAVAHSAEVHEATLTVAVHVVVDSAAALAVDSVEVLIAAVHAAADSAVADSAVAALAAVVPSEEAHTEVVLTVVDIAVAVAAEWADTDKSEHQLPDFRIRHPRNLAH